MKQYMACSLALLFIAGCANTIETPEQIKQTAEAFAQELAQDLETSKDPVKVMDAYIKYFQNNAECYEAGLYVYCYGTKMPDACDGQNGISSHDCQIASALAEPGTKFNCLSGISCVHFLDSAPHCSGGEQSDECILYRRKMHSTEVAYFDYKRFLGNDTRIKNDTLFLHFANAYTKNLGCETEKDTTSLEKQDCKERRDKFFRQAVKQKIHCRDFVEVEYRQWLKDTRQTYNYLKQAWKDTHAEAMKNLQYKADTFSKLYLCDVSGWQQEILK